MKRTIAEHLLSAFLVTCVIWIAISFYHAGIRRVHDDESGPVKPFLDSPVSGFQSPFHTALLRDLLDLYYPGMPDKSRTMFEMIARHRESIPNARIRDAASAVRQPLTAAMSVRLLGMYAKFFLVYVIVMALTYYGVQTIGVWRFVRAKARSERRREAVVGTRKKQGFSATVTAAAAIAGKGILYCLFFSPAYVIAYSIRTEFNTDTVVFMIILALLSNGLLVTYANKFYNLLVTESRKGYVRTAIVKNMNNSYTPGKTGGITAAAIVRPVKNFGDHVFEHIFRNARHQYLSTLKEQASFLISGLVIIEMALNIHGHLCYEMLRQLLYRNFDVVAVIALLIFYTVKITEILTDCAVYREQRMYDNIS